MILKLSQLTPRESISKFLAALNVVNPNPDNHLSETEIMVLTEFLLLPSYKFKYQRFGRLARAKVKDNLLEHQNYEISKVNLNNKIYSLIDKGVLWRDTDKVIYVKEYLEKAVSENMLKAIEENKHFNLTFNFDYT